MNDHDKKMCAKRITTSNIKSFIMENIEQFRNTFQMNFQSVTVEFLSENIANEILVDKVSFLKNSDNNLFP